MAKTKIANTKGTIKLKNVVTVDGTIHPIEKCRKIKENYYLIGDVTKKNSGQCFNIGGTYYICTNDRSKIQWDHKTSQYDFVETLRKGSVSPDGEIGFFSPDLIQNLNMQDRNGNIMYIMNENCVPPDYKYDFADGIFKATALIGSKVPVSAERNKPTYETLQTSYYGFGEDAVGLVRVNTLSERYIKDRVKTSIFDKYFGKYSYGLEIETDGGWLPEIYYYRYGALPLKDGSINGTEITTIPIKQDKMFNRLRELMEAISKYTISTINTSLHINIGNIPNTPAMRVCLWILYCRLQPEIETFIPYYKRDLRFFDNKKGRGKDHCKPQEELNLLKRYPSIDGAEVMEADSTIRRFLNEGSNEKDYVRHGAAKWDQRTRYYALNLLPMYFGDPNNSRVEFRVHSGTVNPTKTIAWTLICSAIVKYAQENQEKILLGKEKILMEDVINYAFNDNTPEGDFTAYYILKYIDARKAEHIRGIERDALWSEEFKNDPGYRFTVNSRDLFNYEKKGT